MEEPTQSIEVRKARQEDTDAIAAIYTESILARDSTMVTDPVSGAEMLERLSGLDPPGNPTRRSRRRKRHWVGYR